MAEFRERDVLERVAKASRELTVRWPQRIAFGPGDDMAGMHLPPRATHGTLLTAIDQVIVGRHVTADMPWRLVGRKAVARNLSDIAAMAARPLVCVASVALPAGTPEEKAWELFEGLRSTAEAYGCPLVGGDTGAHASADAPLVVVVSVLADTPEGRGPILRRGAAVGDGVFVTGALGGAWRPDGRGRHLSFTPRLMEASGLVESIGSRLHAMIDLSDGLGRDAARLAEASGVALRLDGRRLPCNAGCDWRRAVGDGEDYELLFAASGPVPERLGDTPVTRIGEVVPAVPGDGPRVLLDVDGCAIDIAEHGWEHGAASAEPRHGIGGGT